MHQAAFRTSIGAWQRRPWCGVAIGIAMLCGCDGGSSPSADVATPPVFLRDAVAVQHESRQGAFAVRELVTGLEHPWGLAFLPDGGMLVTERPGRLRRIASGGQVSAPLAGVPDVFAVGQSGLLDVAISPRFAADGWVYLSYAEPNWRGNKAGTAVARGRLTDAGLADVEVIVHQEPKLSNGTHVGSRLLFDDSGHLFVTAGDNRVDATAQQLDHLQGKVMRLEPDGAVPDDNPFLDRSGARGEIFSLGHRNPQGMALHPRSRAVWTHEHGPKGGDEINVLMAGANYGWPLVTHGLDYSGSPVEGSQGESAPGMSEPIHYWPVSPAISGMAFYSGQAFPQWQDNLFIGALATRELIRLELDGERVVGEERLLGERGQRIRDVRVGPDGFIYLLTDEPAGSLLRIEPVAQDAAIDP